MSRKNNGEFLMIKVEQFGGRNDLPGYANDAKRLKSLFTRLKRMTQLKK